MTENQDAQRQFAVQRIYVKDISFESPNSPAIFQENWTPKIGVGIATDIADLGNGTMELALKVTVEAKHDGKTVFLAEVVQAGRVTVDLGRREVLVHDVPVEFTTKEFDLLHFLAERPGLALSRQQILVE